MGKPAMKSYPAEFKERAVKLAVESDQPIAQTARDLGVNENTLHTWIGNYHRVERQEKHVQAEHLYEKLKRLRKDNARLKAEREILKKAAASCAPQLPCSTLGYKSSTGRFPSAAYVAFWRSRAVAPTSGSAGLPAPTLTLRSRWRRKSSSISCRAVAPTARAGSSIYERRRACGGAAAALGVCWPRPVSAATPGVHAQRRQLQGQPRRSLHTSAIGSGLCTHQARSPWGIFPPFLQAQAGCISPSCWIGARGRWSGGPWRTIGGQNSCPRRWRWRPVGASLRWG
jgi:transposase